MKIEKAHWQTDGDQVRVTMPLQKVDVQRRIVSGFATLDNPDNHGDIVTAEASAKAFARFRGNLRLMHQPIPAGRLVNFREDEYYDPQTEKFWRGIYVDAYISEGAEDVWKMVTDGTLTGFSIGGSVVDASTEFVKEMGRTVRFITDYEMNELSLVDNPANQLSNIFSIQKSADGDRLEGMISKVEAKNVFYCKKDHDPVAAIGAEDSKSCADCGSEMKSIGWFENEGDRAEKVASIIKRYEADLIKGGENVAEETQTEEQTASAEDATQVEATEVTPKGDETVVAPEQETKESDTATDVVDENVTLTGTGEKQVEEAKEVVQPEFQDGDLKENPLTSLFEGLKDDVQKFLTESSERTVALVTERTAAFEKQLGELTVKHEELSEKFGTLTEKIGSVEKSIDDLGKSGAIKKSSDLGGDEEDSSLQKSNSKGVWRGSIFSSASLGR